MYLRHRVNDERVFMRVLYMNLNGVCVRVSVSVRARKGESLCLVMHSLG